jgi:hypothetical protein
MCYAYNSIALQIKQLEGAFSKLNEDLSQCDRDLSQFYHDVEVKSFNAAEGYYIAKDLQQILHKRRKLNLNKNKLAY